MSQKEILQKVAEGYLSTLVNDNADALIDLVGKNAIVEDPRFPDNKDEADLRKFVAEFQDRVRPMSPRVEYLRASVAQERVLCEDILHVGFNGEKWELPVGTVVANDRETGATRVHVYYTNWPFNKKHSFRRALFTEQQPNRAEFSGEQGHQNRTGPDRRDRPHPSLRQHRRESAAFRDHTTATQ